MDLEPSSWALRSLKGDGEGDMVHDTRKIDLLDLLSAFYQIKPRSTMPHADATTPWFHKRFGADRTKNELTFDIDRKIDRFRLL